MKFLIFGTVLKPSALAYDAAANPASTKWLRGFVNGLSCCGAKVSLCGHCYSQVWPKGKLRPGSPDLLDDSIDHRLVRFWNFPGLRFNSMGHGYLREALNCLNEQSFDAILTYNPYVWNVYAVRQLRKKFGIPWICLNLDFDNVGEKWKHFLKMAGDADGHLFLSHWGYENAPVQHKIHLDSGITDLSNVFGPRAPEDIINIVYLGKLSKTGGLNVLLNLPKLVPNRNIRFIYGGKGYPDDVQKLEALAISDSRVNFLGFVEDNAVEKLFMQADIFLNPRDPEDVVNEMVFPSKIMHYLQTGKTVVSTWTKGLDPAYRDLMLISETSSLEDFSNAVQSAVNESHADRVARCERIKSFLRGSRSWASQAKRFVGFVSGLINKH